MKGVYLNIIKTTYDGSIANIILSGGKTETISAEGMRQVCPLSPLLFNIILEFLPRAINQEEEIKVIQIEKEKVKLSLFKDMILYLKTLISSLSTLGLGSGGNEDSCKLSNIFHEMSNVSCIRFEEYWINTVH
jgi:hypothetical protein